MDLERYGLRNTALLLWKDMYERSKTKVRTLIGSNKIFQIDVGLHQGSALSPFLPIVIILYVLREYIETDQPHATLSADHLY